MYVALYVFLEPIFFFHKNALRGVRLTPFGVLKVVCNNNIPILI